ncbi:hypothetical protein KXV64_007173 [Aspergillus fumigatus]|nr:hypothetical protein KXW29_001228 [Aspergillus fumigatus]KAH2753853.1 hypothetical protein KXV94_001300 [Aspergillus fumigatus]KAH2757502.1 hypothetical protein KXW10_002123 [Aspergillus fumigatus]KAH2842919.1 hypothetical protein KXV85_000236 [Aspergillus fumigatus]KAH2913515.1 hypothetical protein KXW25_000910 [Aspergillus fumigatus]
MPGCLSLCGGRLKRALPLRKTPYERPPTSTYHAPALTPCDNHKGEETISIPAATSCTYGRDEIIAVNASPPPPYNASPPKSVHDGNKSRVDTILTQSAGQDKRYSLGPVLLKAIRGGNVELAKEILRSDADPNAEDSYGFALTQAIRGGNVELAMELLRRRANPDVEDSYGFALTQAIRGGNVELAVELLRRGANPNVEDSYGSAITQARGSGSKRLEEAFLGCFSDFCG